MNDMTLCLIMDGRASYDTDSASIMDTFDAATDKNAKQYMKNEWEGHDCVLCKQVDGKIEVVY